MGLDDDYNYNEFLMVLRITVLKLNSSLRLTNAYFNPCLQLVIFCRHRISEFARPRHRFSSLNFFLVHMAT